MVKDEVGIEIKSNFFKSKYSKILGKELKIGDKIRININTLTKGSHVLVECHCDICGSKKEMMYKTYNKLIQKDKDNKYYCHKCSLEKTKKSCIKKYGVEYPAQSEEIFNKIKKTNMERYGVDIVSKLEKFEKKKSETCLKKYGKKSYLETKKFKEQTEKTMLEKYNIISPIKNKKIYDKIKKTNMERYGVDNVLKSKEIRKAIVEKLNKNTIKKYSDKVDIVSINENGYKIHCKKCKNEYNINKSLLIKRLLYNVEICTICNPINSHVSDKENKIIKFIKENYEFEIIKSDRNIIKPYELDIYLPDLNLAFEFNGLYWHNELHKDKNYHLNKTEKCLEQGIQLIHIWEDSWNYKQEIVKSMILNKLGKTSNKIYARKTEIKEVTNNKLIRDFLDNNHIKGFINSKIKLGLFYENQLVSLMTFVNSKSKNDDEYELLRFCNKLNTNVVGGASKLFKYFTKNYSFTKITTYVDRSHSNGNLYENLGFEFIHKTTPNYYYVIDGIRIKHRFEFKSRKIYRIYDSGSLKYNLFN